MTWTEHPGRDQLGPYNFNELGIDEAFLNISSIISDNLWIYSVSTNCHKCPYQRMDNWNLLTGSGKWDKISTKYPTQFKFRSSDHPLQINYNTNDPETVCDTGPLSFGQFGVYHLQIQTGTPCFQVQEIWPPVNIYYPIFLFIILALIFQIGNYIITTLYAVDGSRRLIKKEIKKESHRLQFIDTFRGLCIILMIFVNDGGGDYNFMRHATWDGLTIADLAFPWFLWLMGVCIPLSMESKRMKNICNVKIFKEILLRSVKLIGIGLLLSLRSWTFENWHKIRILGVLQRIAISYFVCATLFLLLPRRTAGLWRGRLFILLCLLVHWLLTFYLPVPGCLTGYLGPGGLHNNSIWPSVCIGGATGYIDRLILTPNHMARYCAATFVYTKGQEGHLFDPEGLLGTLTSLFQTWLGIEMGHSLLTPSRRLKTYLQKEWLWAFFLGTAGFLLAGGIQNEGHIPVNKNLWSLSYVLVTTSLAVIALTLIRLIEVKGYWDGSPFSGVGKNSMLLYVGHSVGHKMPPWHWQWGAMSSHSIKLLETLWGTSLWVLLATWLHSKKLYWGV